MSKGVREGGSKEGEGDKMEGGRGKADFSLSM